MGQVSLWGWGRSLRAGCLGAIVFAFGSLLDGPVHATPALNAPNITVNCSSGFDWRVFNTGYNGNGGLIATNAGNTDLNWQAAGPFQGVSRAWTTAEVNQIVADPQGSDVAGGGLTTTGWAPAYVANNGAWQAPPASFSPQTAWISQTANTIQPAGSDDFAYLIQFDVASGVNPAAISFVMAFMADNAVTQIYVNGVAQMPVATTGGYLAGGYQTANASQVTLSGFQAGLNSIVVQVESAPAAEGFLASVSGTAACVTTLTPDVTMTLPSTPVTVNELANDVVPTGSTVTAVSDDDPSGADGTWVLNTDGTVTFTPAAGFVGTATATYTVTYPNGTTGTTTITVYVPQLQPYITMTLPSTPVTVNELTNDIVPPDSTVTAVADDDPTDADGAWALNTDGTVTFTPATGFVGIATATYTVTYPNGTTGTTTITVYVPQLQPDTRMTPPSTPVTVNELANDVVPPGSTVTAVADDDPTDADGTWVLNKDGTVTFTPAAGFVGTATATYTVTYPNGTTGTQKIDITVLPPVVPVPWSATGLAWLALGVLAAGLLAAARADGRRKRR